METYCVSYKKYTTNENCSVGKNEQNRLILIIKLCYFVARKKSPFIKNNKLHNFND